jgi:hypothetical protein
MTDEALKAASSALALMGRELRSGESFPAR